MKNLQVILLLCSSFMYSQQKNSGIIEYIVKPNETLDILENAKKEKLPPFLTTPAHFILKFNEKESLYQKKDKSMKIDTKNKLKISFLEIVGGSSSIYYSNSNSREVLLKKEAYGEEFLISHKMTEWLLTQETKKIGEYNCYKAIRKYKDYEKRGSKINSKKSERVSVWFTPQIPVSYGPNLYNGLPGLVLEVNFGKIIFKTTKIILNPQQIVVITRPKKGIRINEKEYYKKATEIGKSIGF